MRLLLTRPKTDSEALAALLRNLGHQCVIAPMLQIFPLPNADLDFSDVQALILTSANTARVLKERNDRNDGAIEPDLRVFAVGDASAEAACAAGFETVISAKGNNADLVKKIIQDLDPKQGRLMHLSGVKTAGDISGDLTQAGFNATRMAIYEARSASELPPETIRAITSQDLDGVLFFSPRTARTFVKLIEMKGLSEHCRALKAFCLSQAVAEEIKDIQWAETVITERPDQQALIDEIDA